MAEGKEFMTKSQKPTVTTKNHLSDESIVYNHPAFGMIRFGRTSGSQVLFGSEVDNAGHISVEITRGEEYWHLHEKHYHGEGGLPIIRLAMSYAQFAEAICNQNCGEGIPCTLEYVNGERMPTISKNTVSTSEQIKLDIKEQEKKINKSLAALYTEIDKLTVSKAQKENLRRGVDNIERELNSNLPFIIDQCEEAVEHIVTKGKIEVEAFVQGRIREAGMQALADSIVEGKTLLKESH